MKTKKASSSLLASHVRSILLQKGFTPCALKNAIRCNGGKSEVWEKRLSEGSVVVRFEVYHHHFPRMALEFGVRLDRFLEVFDRHLPTMEPWPVACGGGQGLGWYPHFQFGWAMGQGDARVMEFVMQGIAVPDELLHEPVVDESVREDVFAMEAFAKSLCFGDQADSVDSQLEQVSDVVSRDALPVMERCASEGRLNAELFGVESRISPFGPAAASFALGRDFLASEPLRCQNIAGLESRYPKRLQSNFDVLRRLVVDMRRIEGDLASGLAS